MSHTHDRQPVIRREWKSDDSNAEIESTIHDNTSFHRGMGTSGRRVQHTSGYECPFCGHDEMIRLVHVAPDSRDSVQYWCLRPNCPYFIADELSWALGPDAGRQPKTPMQWDQTHVCEDCGSRWTEAIDRATFADRHVADGIVTQFGCDRCTVATPEVETDSDDGSADTEDAGGADA